jgi:hypothetical protein
MKLYPSAYVFALATVALHLAFCHRFGYYRDELYFIDCAKHLAWGYVDQPPLAPFVTWLTAPWGYPVWGLRFFPGLLSGVTLLFGCAIAAEFGAGAFAQTLTALMIFFAPGLIGIAYGLSTEFVSPAAWTVLIYLTLRLVKTQDTRWYYPIALVVTIAMYAKYSIAACAIALLIGLAVTGHANLLRSRRLAAAVGLTLLLVLPNALWQIHHGLPMMEVIHNDQLNRHALANGMADESANRWINAIYMFALQFLYNNPLFAPVWIWGIVWLWNARRSAVVSGHGGYPYRFLAVAYFLLFGLLIVTIGRGYYIQGVYPALFGAGAVAIENALGGQRKQI